MKNNNQAFEASQHIKNHFPSLAGLIESVGPIDLPTGLGIPLDVAMTKIIAGQMLSGAVAKLIGERIERAKVEEGVAHSWLVSATRLRECGLSGRKIRTLCEFGNLYQCDSSIQNIWPQLKYEDLLTEVSRIWGLGEWSAAMLAIFHFGHEDVFPVSDGSLQRAITLIPDRRKNSWLKKGFPHLKVSPFRSYLCLYLWAGLDRGYFQGIKQGGEDARK